MDNQLNNNFKTGTMPSSISNLFSSPKKIIITIAVLLVTVLLAGGILRETVKRFSSASIITTGGACGGITGMCTSANNEPVDSFKVTSSTGISVPITPGTPLPDGRITSATFDALSVLGYTCVAQNKKEGSTEMCDSPTTGVVNPNIDACYLPENTPTTGPTEPPVPTKPVCEGCDDLKCDVRYEDSGNGDFTIGMTYVPNACVQNPPSSTFKCADDPAHTLVLLRDNGQVPTDRIEYTHDQCDAIINNKARIRVHQGKEDQKITLYSLEVNGGTCSDPSCTGKYQCQSCPKPATNKEGCDNSCNFDISQAGNLVACPLRDNQLLVTLLGGSGRLSFDDDFATQDDQQLDNNNRTATHTYSDYGTYNVTLDCGTTSCSQKLTVACENPPPTSTPAPPTTTPACALPKPELILKCKTNCEPTPTCLPGTC